MKTTIKIIMALLIYIIIDKIPEQLIILNIFFKNWMNVFYKYRMFNSNYG